MPTSEKWAKQLRYAVTEPCECSKGFDGVLTSNLVRIVTCEHTYTLPINMIFFLVPFLDHVQLLFAVTTKVQSLSFFIEKPCGPNNIKQWNDM